MKIEGRNHSIYEYKNTVVRKSIDGDVHDVTNRSGCEIVLLKSDKCTKEMERRLLNVLNGIEEWNGQPIRDILYTHGKLKGYVCIKEEIPDPVYRPEPNEVPTTPPIPERKTGESVSILENPLLRIVYLVIAIICCAFISTNAFYTPLLKRAYLANSETGSLLATFSINGKLGILVGIIITLICAVKMFKSNSIVFFVLIPIIALLSSGITYCLIRFTISLVSTAANIFLALLPELVVLGILIMVIKSLLGK